MPDRRSFYLVGLGTQVKKSWRSGRFRPNTDGCIDQYLRRWRSKDRWIAL